MKKTKYGFSLRLPLDFDTALELTISALKDHGFGVLTEIDVKETLKNKLNVDFKRYIILGACNPPLAYKALSIEEEIGLLLPCNVIVYEDGDNSSKVVVIDPYEAKKERNPDLDHITGEARKKLRLSLLKLSTPEVEPAR